MQELVAMGFSEYYAKDALEKCSGNKARAAELLAQWGEVAKQPAADTTAAAHNAAADSSRSADQQSRSVTDAASGAATDEPAADQTDAGHSASNGEPVASTAAVACQLLAKALSSMPAGSAPVANSPGSSLHLLHLRTQIE